MQHVTLLYLLSLKEKQHEKITLEQRIYARQASPHRGGHPRIG
jgi:hypothetical protein